MPVSTLPELIALLKQGPVEPLPPGEEWGQMIARTSAAGRVAEIDEETYGYFLDVLPPRWMGPGGFAFGEGADLLRLLWRFGGRYFCRQLSDEENLLFCRLARIGLTSG